ncbi:winged helix-turn-helix transcriptional regulator [Streptomyces sp. NPDC006365]|uniref:winged helix-turn-helix transcriptional regulator n=1 Tax=Streptomyces sp. NPDC006365 TaxID=3364744 RepID=UPI00367F04D3
MIVRQCGWLGSEVGGEKWTILILREVWYGSSRFSDFEHVLGCPRNLLAARTQPSIPRSITRPDRVRDRAMNARTPTAALGSMSPPSARRSTHPLTDGVSTAHPGRSSGCSSRKGSWPPRPTRSPARVAGPST